MAGTPPGPPVDRAIEQHDRQLVDDHDSRTLHDADDASSDLGDHAAGAAVVAD